MTVLDEYLASLGDAQTKLLLKHMYNVVRETVPDATEELSYAMPAFKYKGKGLVAIMANKEFLSLYPFQSIERLELDLSAYECTTGSIHFSLEHPISDDLLRAIVASRKKQIGA